MCVFQDMFIAGTDTAAATVEWTMTELVRHPDILAKAQKEVRGAVAGKDIVLESDLPRLKYLKQVIRESMRVHPPPRCRCWCPGRPSSPSRCTAARYRPGRGCS
jgi:hypothetical protein